MQPSSPTYSNFPDFSNFTAGQFQDQLYAETLTAKVKEHNKIKEELGESYYTFEPWKHLSVVEYQQYNHAREIRKEIKQILEDVVNDDSSTLILDESLQSDLTRIKDTFHNYVSRIAARPYLNH